MILNSEGRSLLASCLDTFFDLDIVDSVKCWYPCKFSSFARSLGFGRKAEQISVVIPYNIFPAVEVPSVLREVARKFSWLWAKLWFSRAVWVSLSSGGMSMQRLLHRDVVDST